MSNTVISSNMNLPVPIVGTELGPQYAIDINDCMGLIDSHDHTSGNGVTLTQLSLNLTADLTFNSFNATDLRSARFTSQSSPLALGSDFGCVYVVLDDLYYNDGLGNQIRLTQSGAVAGTSGSISNLVAPASASYNASSKTFIWQQNTNQAANMDMATAILRPIAASAAGISLVPPIGLAASYAMTLLSALPAGTRMITIDNAGNLGTWNLDNSTITVSSNVIGVPTSGIATANIADSAVTTVKIADANVTSPKIADASVTTAKINNSAVTTAKLADGAVTLAKMAALNYGQSGSSGSFSSNSTSYVSVTNLSVTLTMSGGPFEMSLQSATTGETVGVASGALGFMQYLEDGVVIACDTWNGAAQPCSRFNLFVNSTSAGSHTYTIKARSSSAGGNILFTNCRLVVRER